MNLTHRPAHQDAYQDAVYGTAAARGGQAPDPPSVAPYRILAERVGVGFLPAVEADRLVMQDSACMELLRRPDPVAAACLGGTYEAPTILVGPSRRSVDSLKRLRAQSPQVRARFRVIPHIALRAAMFRRVCGQLTRNAVFGLFDAYPQYSARIVLSTWQAVIFTACLIGGVLLAAFAPGILIDCIRVLATLAFFGCTLLRIMAAVQAEPPTDPAAEPDGPEPTYSVLVALRNEAEIVPQLLTALSRIVWPRDRLEIKLVCEADDRRTIEAIRAHALRDYVELIEVPPSVPRTKPKALRYALQATTGDYVVLYDAEDIPHPMQLREAWRRFASSGPELACLQAPLEITNGRASWIAAMFAFEYAGLFRCLLPWLAQRRTVLPLGGTSNHFRREALEDVGAWDPHNVTEDADLGIRLTRMGYRCDVISLPTSEEAPEAFEVWRPQRTRWCKGWMQTWLVHMRQPLRLAADLGPRSFILCQILLFGIVFSSLAHPILLLLIANSLWWLAAGMTIDTREAILLGLDAFNVICAYGGFIAIGVAGRNQDGANLWRTVAATPAYWMMMSYAAWLAVFELWWRPFRWNKTPHKPKRRLKAGAYAGLS